MPPRQFDSGGTYWHPTSGDDALGHSQGDVAPLGGLIVPVRLATSNNRWGLHDRCSTGHPDNFLHFQLQRDSLGSTRSQAGRHR